MHYNFEKISIVPHRQCEYFLSTPLQLAAKQRKVGKEKETLIGQ
jgi:hypothetical protein